MNNIIIAIAVGAYTLGGEREDSAVSNIILIAFSNQIEHIDFQHMFLLLSATSIADFSHYYARLHTCRSLHHFKEENWCLILFHKKYALRK